MTMRHASKRIVTTLMAAFLGVTAAAQEAPVETNTTQESLQPVTATSRDAVQSRLAALKAIALKAAEALPEGVGSGGPGIGHLQSNRERVHRHTSHWHRLRGLHRPSLAEG